jgi:hypothetical protein
MAGLTGNAFLFVDLHPYTSNEILKTFSSVLEGKKILIDFAYLRHSSFFGKASPHIPLKSF